MSSADQVAVLRERNKDLLNRLKQQKEELERPSGSSQSRKRGREAAEVLAGEGRGPARAAPAKPTVRFADTCESQKGVQSSISTPSLKHRGGTGEHTAPSNLFTDGNRHPVVHSRLQDMKSCRVHQRNERRDVKSRVTFPSDESDELSDELSASQRHRLQPLLGYDWIAGVLDAEDYSIERSDEFFDDLRAFRSLNKEECVHSPRAEFREENHSALPPLTEEDVPEANTDTHRCTFSYRINSRLFPVPLHSECCPVCKEPKSSRPHTTAEPALIRVSIPRSNFLPPYKYKAHRRCSFDPSDSLGLPSHCLSGWSNTGQSTLPPPGNLDLRSSLNRKSVAGSQIQDLEDLSAPRGSGKQISDQIEDVSRLARHNFQHFSPKRSLGSTFYPLH